MPNVTSLYDSSGAGIALGEELGSGGEGAVFAIRGSPSLVAKLYHTPVDAAKAAKLAAMSQASSPELLKIAAWPIDLLRGTPGGRVAGLLMPRVQQAREAHNLYSPKQRRAEFPNADWSFLIWVARNAAAAVETVHRAGHVIGDINQKGFLVGKDATVRLIDCDSFQIIRNGARFLCLVGVPEFTPPELHGQSFDKVERTPNHDSFGLAVLIFHLLFMGRHPFVGRYQGAGDMPIERAIRELRFAYSQTAATKQMVPPPYALPLSASSFHVASLFERAFGPAGIHGSRPSATEWVKSLESLSRNELAACAADAGHKYYKSLPRCPWCEIERSGGPAFFITVVPTVRAGGGAFDFQAFWTFLSSAPLPTPVSIGALAGSTPEITPATIPSSVRTRRSAAKVCYAAAFVSTLLIFGTLVPWPICALIALALGVAGRWLNANPEWKREQVSRKAALDTATHHWKGLVESWEREVGGLSESFQSKKRELRGLAEEYKQLPEQAKKEKESLHRQREALQKNAFLDRHYLRQAKLTGIGTGLKATLVSEGFETAADINATVTRVAGIGQARYTTLMAWRASIENQFRFNPNVGVNQVDLNAVDHKIAVRRGDIERKLLHGRSELETFRRRFENLNASPSPRFVTAAHRLAQAKADLAVL